MKHNFKKIEPKWQKNWDEGRAFAAVHPLSALKRKGLQELVETLLPLLPKVKNLD